MVSQQHINTHNYQIKQDTKHDKSKNRQMEEETTSYYGNIWVLRKKGDLEILYIKVN